MQTRTLLLLSLVCGLAILFAGMALVIQLANRADVAPPQMLGEPVAVGDMTVVVDGSSESSGQISVDILIGGVDDPSGSDGFRMIASARPAPLIEGCGPITVELEPCTLEFEVVDDGGSRQLIYDRGDQSARWVLRATPAG